MTARALAALALACVVPSCMAQAQTKLDPYLLVRLLADGKAYEYSVDLTDVKAVLRASCDDSEACPFYANADKDPDILAEKEEESFVRSRLKVAYFSRVSLDHTRTSAIVAEADPGKDNYKFEVFKLPSATVERSGTTTRRIADAVWIGTKGCFVLLTTTYSTGFMPWHWPAILAGHPPQYNTWYLELYGPDATRIDETVVHEKLKYSSGGLIKRRAREAKMNNEPVLRPPC
jgi:hypothetical protein